MWYKDNDQLPSDLFAQLVELCIGLAEVMDSNRVQAWIFFSPYFHHYSSSVHSCEDHYYIDMDS